MTTVNVKSRGTFDCVLSFGSSSSMSPVTYINTTPCNILAPQNLTRCQTSVQHILSLSQMYRRKKSLARKLEYVMMINMCVCARVRVYSFVSGTGVENAENVPSISKA